MAIDEIVCIRESVIDTEAWKTLVAAMPDSLTDQYAEDVGHAPRRFYCKLLLTALGRMPDLNNLSLTEVTVELDNVNPVLPICHGSETVGDVVCVKEEDMSHRYWRLTCYGLRDCEN